MTIIVLSVKPIYERLSTLDLHVIAANKFSRKDCVALQVQVGNAERQAGLKLAPDRREIIVIDRPIDGLTFSQFSAKIAGTVSCLGEY